MIFRRCKASYPLEYGHKCRATLEPQTNSNSLYCEQFVFLVIESATSFLYTKIVQQGIEIITI